MKNKNSIPVDRLKVLLSNLLEIMEKEKEDNWIHSVHTCVNLLEEISKNGENSEKLDTIKSLLKSMLTGYANIFDFFVWREDYNERLEANKKLEMIQKQIWENVNDFIFARQNEESGDSAE